MTIKDSHKQGTLGADEKRAAAPPFFHPPPEPTPQTIFDGLWRRLLNNNKPRFATTEGSRKSGLRGGGKGGGAAAPFSPAPEPAAANHLRWFCCGRLLFSPKGQQQYKSCYAYKNNRSSGSNIPKAGYNKSCGCKYYCKYH